MRKDLVLQKRIYYLKPRSVWRTLSIILLLLTWSLTILLIVPVFFDDNYRSRIWLVFIFLMLSLCLNFITHSLYWIFNSFAEVSEQGMLFHGGYFTLYMPWRSILQIHVGPRMSIVILKEDADIQKTLREGQEQNIAVLERHRWTGWMGPTAWLLKRERRAIFISGFMISSQQWKNGEVHVYLERYAPHLVETIQ